mmetsp:Transcript_33066/g.40005  ORF Transcript_33066/g.40005 Transcript_33066/m.40005 type:complete len:117 (-) Transcript_33066:1379-1729(-)
MTAEEGAEAEDAEDDAECCEDWDGWWGWSASCCVLLNGHLLKDPFCLANTRAASAMSDKPGRTTPGFSITQLIAVDIGNFLFLVSDAWHLIASSKFTRRAWSPSNLANTDEFPTIG